MDLVGKIVRRKTPSGKLIGPYLLVQAQMNDIIFVKNVTNNNIYRIHKFRVAKMNYLCLRVSKHIFKKLRDNKQHIVIHPLTPLYQKLLCKDYELIKFQDSFGDFVYYTLINALHYKSLLENKDYVRVYLDKYIIKS